MIRKVLCLLLALNAPAWAASAPPAEGAHAMVVTVNHLATEAGVEVLRQGGNAVDAAVAVAYALAVVDSCCGNIGGGGFMLIHLADGQDHFINFREMAPQAATARMYLDAEGKPIKGASLFGIRAVGVPGTVAGLEMALTRYGTMPRAKLMQAAIQLAQGGFVLTRANTDILDTRTAAFGRNPELARIFLRPDGAALQPGDRLTQPDLARTLSEIAANGPDAFYKGRIPQAVAALSKRDGGVIAEADFAAYRAEEIAPLRCDYHGATIISSPPPSSGGVTLCETLNILANDDLHALGWHSAAGVHLLVEAMRRAYFDRNANLGDPDFVKIPLDRLLSKDYAASLRAQFTDRATPSASLGSVLSTGEKKQTTHFSILDQAGNAVSMTFTINGSFGALAMAEGTGFLLNNEMDDFTTVLGAANLYGLVQGEANTIAPGKRPLSSMTPTIVLRDGKVAMVTGSPGGSRIITITLQSMLNVLDFGMNTQEAVDAPRIHHQFQPDVIYAEPYALSPDTKTSLQAMDYKIIEQVPWGAAEMIAVGPEHVAVQPGMPANDAALSGRMRPGLLYGASDNRRPAGSAAGF